MALFAGNISTEMGGQQLATTDGRPWFILGHAFSADVRAAFPNLMQRVGVRGLYINFKSRLSARWYFSALDFVNYVALTVDDEESPMLTEEALEAYLYVRWSELFFSRIKV